MGNWGGGAVWWWGDWVLGMKNFKRTSINAVSSAGFMFTWTKNHDPWRKAWVPLTVHMESFLTCIYNIYVYVYIYMSIYIYIHLARAGEVSGKLLEYSRKRAPGIVARCFGCWVPLLMSGSGSEPLGLMRWPHFPLVCLWVVFGWVTRMALIQKN